MTQLDRYSYQIVLNTAATRAVWKRYQNDHGDVPAYWHVAERHAEMRGITLHALMPVCVPPDLDSTEWRKQYKELKRLRQAIDSVFPRQNPAVAFIQALRDQGMTLEQIADEVNDVINQLILVCNPTDLRHLERNAKLAHELFHGFKPVPREGQAAMILVSMFDALNLKTWRREAIIAGKKADRIRADDIRHRVT